MRRSVMVVIVCVLVGVTMNCAKKSVIDKSQGVDPITEFKALVSEHIQDADKRAEILEIVNKGDARLDEFYEYYGQYAETISSLSGDYNATRAGFEDATSEFNAKYREILMGLVADRFAIKKLTTREEWALISDAEHSFVTD